MKQSLFVKYIAYLGALISGVVGRIDAGETENSYWFKTMLTEELSTDLRWNTLIVNSRIISADVVSMDSALPLKSRDSLGSADGDIVKIGMKKQMSEKQLSDIDVLMARKVNERTIIEKIFNDPISCTIGIHEKLEFIFLRGLSTGVGLIEDPENVGSGIRLDYGYLGENKFGVSTAWSDEAAKPMDDIKRIVSAAKAKGTKLKFMILDQNTFDNLAANEQVRQYFAFSQNFTGGNIPIPDFDQVNSLLQKREKIQIKIADRTIITERDGKRTVHNPWAENMIVFLEQENVGRLVYGILAEETRQSPAASYEKAGSYILIKKWSSEEPFAEFTSGQALAVPVIDGVDGIYLLNSEEATAGEDTQTEGDSNYTYNEQTYTKTAVIAAINAAYESEKAKASNLDKTLARYIDEMNEAQVLVFEGNLA